jgi:hypothetical protein
MLSWVWLVGEFVDQFDVVRYQDGTYVPDALAVGAFVMAPVERPIADAGGDGVVLPGGLPAPVPVGGTYALMFNRGSSSWWLCRDPSCADWATQLFPYLWCMRRSGHRMLAAHLADGIGWESSTRSRCPAT